MSTALRRTRHPATAFITLPSKVTQGCEAAEGDRWETGLATLREWAAEGPPRHVHQARQQRRNNAAGTERHTLHLGAQGKLPSAAIQFEFRSDVPNQFDVEISRVSVRFTFDFRVGSTSQSAVKTPTPADAEIIAMG